MKLRPLASVAALAGVMLVGGCATQVAPDDPVYQKLDALQRQVNHLQKVVQGQGLMNMASDQQQLEQEVTELQGQIEQLQHDLQQSQEREQSVDKAFDQRLAALEQGASAVGIRAGVSSGGQTSGGGEEQASAMPPPVQNAGGGSSGSSSSGGGSSDYAAYQSAFNELVHGNDSEAISRFKDFVQKYPNSRFVPNAWYWMGSAYYVDGHYKEAVADFQTVLTKYPDSAKAQDSYLKMGKAQEQLKEYSAARQTFQQLIQRYPGTTAADLAQQRLQQMGSGGG